MNPQTILVTGATGYIGGRLIPVLLERGYRVRAFGRSLEKLKSRFWASHEAVENVQGDVLDTAALAQAMQGCMQAYYLVHSMLPGQKNFEETDRCAAHSMKDAAESAKIQRIIYLSGLGEDEPKLSKHLKSRSEVAAILKSGKVPVTVLRAAIVIGSGSASFEILRYLVERLPVMVTPRWVNTSNQPVAVRNVIEYLAGCLDKEETFGETYDIGGTQVLTYRELMRIYAKEAGLRKRLVIPVPVLTPRLSSYWIHLVTPVPASIARPLAEGLRNPVICKDFRLREIIPQHLLDCREAVRYALQRVHADDVPTRWTDAGKVPPVESLYDGDPSWAGGTVFRDVKKSKLSRCDLDVWKSVESIGGKTGWYYADWLWACRGFLDRLLGGVGLRRGRRNQDELKAGDALDFWRVVDIQPRERLLLVAEMKLPGKATLEFRITHEEDACFLEQRASFYPRGLWGIVYWYMVLPFHYLIFSAMIKRIAEGR